MVRDRYLYVSLLIHVLLIGFLFVHFPHRDKSSNDSGDPLVNVEIIEHEDKKDVPEVPKIVPVADLPVPKKISKESDDCPHFFGGIGVTINTLNPIGEEITIVHHGYPAEAAGMMAGDIIVAVEGGSVTGEVGTTVNMTVYRNGQSLQFSIVRGKICY